jgi:phage baseplate assembly protein W
MTSKIVSDIAITLPFSISAYGKVADTTDQSKIWSDRVRSAVGTLFYERVMRPGYGTSIPTQVFNNPQEVADTITSEVKRVFAQELTQLTLDSVNVYFDDYSSVLNADITYGLPDKTTVNVNIGLASISADGTISQETL